FGASTTLRLAQEQLDWVNLDAIWISHLHLDHVGGLAPFLFGTRHAPQINSRTKPLFIYGPKGLIDVVQKFNLTAKQKLLKQPFPVEITEILTGDRFEPVKGIWANTFWTPHTDESLAIRIEDI